MKINDAVKTACAKEGFNARIETSVCCLVNPAEDVDHECSEEEIKAVREFTRLYVNSLKQLMVQACEPAMRIFRQDVNVLYLNTKQNMALRNLVAE